MCKTEILSNDPEPHTVWCSTYPYYYYETPYFREDAGTNATSPYFWKKDTNTGIDYPYYDLKIVYPDIIISLDEPQKMNAKIKIKITLKFADGREIVIKAGNENED